MGDDDIICLSSDDETSPAEPQTKKSKVAEEPIKLELESSEHQRRCYANLKRKPAARNGDEAEVTKRPRVSANGSVEEIVVESSIRSSNGESKSRGSAESRDSSKSSSSRSDGKRSERREAGGASSSNAATGIRKEDNNRRESREEEVARGVKNLFAKPSDVRTSSGRQDAEVVKFSGREASSASHTVKQGRASVARFLDVETRRRVENSYQIALNDGPVHSKSPTATTFEIPREKLSSASNERRHQSTSSKDPDKGHREFVASTSKSSRESTDSRTSREHKSGSSRRHDRETKSHHRHRVPEKSNEAAGKIVGDNEASRRERSKRCSEDGTKERASSSRRSSPSKSPKGSSSKSHRTSGEKSRSERTSKSSPSSKKPSLDVKEIVTAAKTSRNIDADDVIIEVPRAKDESASRQTRDDATVGSRQISSSDISRMPQSSPKKQDADERKERTSPKTSSKGVLVKSVATLSKRITPVTLAVTKKSPEVTTKPTSELSKDDGSPKSSKDREQSTKAFEPVAGCSKTPDDVFAETSCSSSTRDESRPHLVVKTKTPVVSVEQDNFAMFLSLCLQTDRSPQMEKIIAKLKRNYEQLDPAYARSRAFIKLVNSIREKIAARGRVYYYIGQVAEEMKIRRDHNRSSKTSKDKQTIEENTENEAVNDPAGDDEDPEENRQESRRLRKKIKTIEIAMKKCSRKIEELEVAEVDFDDDNNSQYIMLERYKEKMVELYAKLCEYTNEHADAGRAYLRPKHLRVCQIPSIDQAINSFVNSKLSSNRKKTQSGKSFVDGLVFPDYVDILECVAKVNEEQNLGLDKRGQQKLAEDAFTRLGKHLQDARQKDYWDTFSLHLENSKDPATVDATLSEKLLENQAIAEKNTREIFEKYVKKQEEGKATDHESSGSDTDDEDDDEDDNDDDDDEDNDKKSNCEVNDVVLSDIGDNDDNDVVAEDSTGEGDDDGSSRIFETINESVREAADPDIEEQATRTSVEDSTSRNNIATSTNEEMVEELTDSPERTEETFAANEPMEIEESSSEARSPKDLICESVDDALSPDVRCEEDATNENNNVLKTCETRTEDQIGALDETEECLIENETTKNEVNPSDEAAPEVRNDGVTEPPRILRIRSFAKPPSSWASSQELDNTKSSDQAPKAVSLESETIDLLDDDIEELDAPTASAARPSESSAKEASRVTRPMQQQTLNGASRVYPPSKLVKIVPKTDSSSIPKQFTLLPGVKIQPMNGQVSQHRNGQQPQRCVGGNSVVTTRPLNASRNIKITAANPTPSAPSAPVNVRVCTLDKSQRLGLRVTNNLRTLPPGQLKFVKLTDKLGLARANSNLVVTDNASPIPLRPRPPPNPIQVTQPLQIQSVNNVQAMRLRVAPNSQILQQSKAQPQQQQQQQQQVVRLSNGHLMKASPASIRPVTTGVAALAPSVVPHPRGIALNNPRIIRLPGNALTGATVARLTDTGQLRVERIDNNAASRSRSLLNGGGLNNAPRGPTSALPSTRSPREQRTNPLHKSINARKDW